MKQIILRLLVIMLAFASAIVVIANVRAERNSGGRYDGINAASPAQSPAAATAAQEKTTEQVQKNIKVLTGLPQSQLIPVMNYMAASLGRRCNYCHVNNNGQWDYASDEKKEKDTAREMIKLVLDVNKNSFNGNPEVGCYTCHRGRNNPQGVPTLPLPAPSPQGGNPGARPGGAAPGGAGNAQQPQPSPTPRPSPPSGDEIVAKYVTAIGGQAAIDKIKTRTMKGSITTSNGQTLTYEIAQTAPNKAYEMFTSQRGSMERGINGDTGWEKNPQGVHDLTGMQLADLRISLQLFRNLNLKDQYSRLRFGGRDKVGDREAVVLNAGTADNRSERLFFDAETGLLVRRITYTRTMIGVIPEQTDFLDYREVDGVKMPFTIILATVDAGNPSSTRKFDEIKVNPPIEDSKFNKPKATTP